MSKQSNTNLLYKETITSSFKMLTFLIETSHTDYSLSYFKYVSSQPPDGIMCHILHISTYYLF